MTARFLVVSVGAVGLSFNWLWPSLLAADLGHELPLLLYAGWSGLSACAFLLLFFRLLDRGP